jgi:hypothetical protein
MTRYNKRRSNKQRSNKQRSNKQRSNKRIIARGKMNNKTPRRLSRNEYLTQQDIEGIILTGGDEIQMSYWSRTGHDLVEDLKNLSLERGERGMVMGPTLYNQAVWKLGEWLKGNYGDDYIS